MEQNMSEKFELESFDYPGDSPECDGEYLVYYGSGIWDVCHYNEKSDSWWTNSKIKCWSKLPDMRVYDTLVRMPDDRIYIQYQRDYAESMIRYAEVKRQSDNSR